MCSIVCNTHERADGNRPLPGINMMKKILVTGASGGIGSQTAVALQNAVAMLRCITRKIPKKPKALPKSLQMNTV